MDLLNKLLGKTPDSKDIRLKLKEIEREQGRKRRSLEELQLTKQQKVEEAIAAKRVGKQDLLRDLFRETRQVEIDHEVVESDLRRLSLTKITLNSILRKVEMLEHKKDHKSLQNLVARFRDSDIQKAIDGAEVDDDSFNSMLEDVMGEEEAGAVQGKAKEDVGFAEFDRVIEDMARGGDSGAGAESRFEYQEQRLKSPASGQKGFRGIRSETAHPVFAGLEVADATPSPSPSPSPAPTPDDCKDDCVGGSATYARVHG